MCSSQTADNHVQHLLTTDKIIRATAFDHAVRAFACCSTQVCQEAVWLHNLSPIAAAALGRLMTGLLMLAEDLDKPGDSLSAIVRADGPLGGLTVVAEQNATVRGMVQQPVVETGHRSNGKLDVGAAVGKGTLTIIRDLQLKEPYVGRVALVSGEIAEDLASYLAVSEQIPSIVSLGVKMTAQGITHAGGLMVQLMPETDTKIVEYLEEQVRRFPETTTLLEQGATPEDMLRLLLGETLQIHTERPCAYACPCSHERMVKNLIAMGQTELSQLAEDSEGIELQCHFCSKQYHFSQREVGQLITVAQKR